MSAQRIVRFLGASVGALMAALGLAFGCSSSGAPSAPSGGDDGGDATAADAPEDHPGEGSHDGAPPDALYGCALPGSFGAPCTLSASGPDSKDCTDPKYPQCFVGGQGAWCTKTCTGTADCTTGIEDGGCAPTGCNGRGYCK
jgi:hypothetical protein